LRFVLAEPDTPQGQQQQQHLRVADRDSDDDMKGGVFEFTKTARAATDAAAAAEPTEDAAAAAAAAAATEGSGESPGDAAQQQQDREQLQQLEQQLGGRLLSVHQMWQNMPLAVALQVGCTISLGMPADAALSIELVWLLCDRRLGRDSLQHAYLILQAVQSP
jgi:hypothetical protein